LRNLLLHITKIQIATAIAILFHFFGVIGILFWDKNFFIGNTPLNLLLMLGLLWWTQENRNFSFILFAAIAMFTGYVVEVIGVNTGMLFGNYYYGNVMGLKWKNVPLLIGANWWITIYCCGIFVHTLLDKIVHRLHHEKGALVPKLKALSVIVDGATLAVAFDWLMEPVAVKLGFWFWKGDGNIPLYNYVCWFIISAILLSFFHFSAFPKRNKFAIHLLLIQAMFFLLLRSFL
jgi:putative membrane protein